MVHQRDLNLPGIMASRATVVTLRKAGVKEELMRTPGTEGL